MLASDACSAPDAFRVRDLLSKPYRLAEVDQALDDLEAGPRRSPTDRHESLRRANAMRIGIDFDNTIACYDGVFHASRSSAA